MTAEEIKAKLEERRGRLGAIKAEATDLQKQWHASGRKADDANYPRLLGLTEEADQIADEIKGLELDERMARVTNAGSQSLGRLSAPSQPQPPSHQPSAQRPVYTNRASFIRDVRAAAVPGGQMSPALYQYRQITNANPTTFATEQDGASLGILVPQDIRSEVSSLVFADDNLFGRCNPIPSSAFSVKFPVDETTPWGTTGITAYWEDEGGLMTQSKPTFQAREMRLNKLVALVPVTEELMQDAPALESFLVRSAVSKMQWKLNNAIFRGTGVGQPSGVLNHNSLVTQNKEGSQPAATIMPENIVKMWARLLADGRPRAVWLVSPSLEAALPFMSIKVKNVAGSENVGGFPAYMQPNGISGQPYGTLMGRPVIPTQFNPVLGTVGDIVLGDFAGGFFAGYQTTGNAVADGIRMDMSMHLWFDYGINAYRFTMRAGAIPTLSAAVSQANETATLGRFIALETRS